MSMLNSRIWAFKQTFRGIWHAKTLFVLALALAGLALTIPVFIGLLTFSLSKPGLDVSLATEITVFTDRAAGKNTVAQLSEKIAAVPRVSETRIVPKEEALAQVNQSLGLKTRKAGSNPLPDIIVATIAKNASEAEITAAAEAIQKIDGVDSIAYDDQWSVHLAALIKAISVTMATFGAIILALVLLVIGASVRMTTAAQSDEMRVLYLFGATDSFIKRPYVWRGFLTMALAAMVSLELSHIGLQLLAVPLANFMKLYGATITLSMPSADWCTIYVLGSALVGAFIGDGVASHAVSQMKKI